MPTSAHTWPLSSADGSAVSQSTAAPLCYFFPLTLFLCSHLCSPRAVLPSGNAPPALVQSSLGSSVVICFTVVFPGGCRGNSSLVPGDLLLYFSYFGVHTSASHFFPLLLCLSDVYCPFSHTLSQRSHHLGCWAQPRPAVGSVGASWNLPCLAWGSPGLSSQRPPLKTPLLPHPWHLHPIQTWATGCSLVFLEMWKNIPKIPNEKKEKCTLVLPGTDWLLVGDPYLGNSEYLSTIWLPGVWKNCSPAISLDSHFSYKRY